MLAFIKRNCLSCKTPKKAVKKEHPGCLHHLVKKGQKLTLATMLKAIAKRNYRLISVFIKHKITPDPQMTFAAAKVGDIDLLKYFLKLNFPWDPMILPMAIQSHFLHLISFLMPSNLPCNVLDVQIAAVKANNLSVLQYFASKDIPLKSELTYCAAFEGNLDILTFCVEHGCTPTPHVVCGAVKGNHVRCLTYLSHLPNFYSDVSWHPHAVRTAVLMGAYECLIILCRDRPIGTLNVDLLELVQAAVERSFNQIALYLLALYRSSFPPAYQAAAHPGAPAP